MHPWNNIQMSRRGIAIDPRNGDSYRMNDSAAFILSQLQRNISPQAIATAMTAEFEVSYESALSDVYEFTASICIQVGA